MLIYQVDISRELHNRIRGSWGNVMYSSIMFRDNIQGTVDYFATYIYPQPALQPQFHWLAANISIPIAAPKITVSSNGRLYLCLDKMTESKFINQIAIYKLNENEWGLFKVFPVTGLDKDHGMELEKGHYTATLVDRFGRESMKSYFEI